MGRIRTKASWSLVVSGRLYCGDLYFELVQGLASSNKVKRSPDLIEIDEALKSGFFSNIVGAICCRIPDTTFIGIEFPNCFSLVF